MRFRIAIAAIGFAGIAAGLSSPAAAAGHDGWRGHDRGDWHHRDRWRGDRGWRDQRGWQDGRRWHDRRAWRRDRYASRWNGYGNTRGYDGYYGGGYRR